MANVSDLLGALLQRGMTDSSKSRIENSLSENGIGGSGGILEQLGLAPAKTKAPAGAQSRAQAPAGGPPDVLGKLGSVAKSIFGEGESDKSNPLAAGGLGALVGAVLGGGGKSVKGAIGGGALALLGTIALQALRASQQKAGATEIDSDAKLVAGLRQPQNPQEVRKVESIADLTVKAMINAAKADGRIDEDEMQRVVGELQGDGISETERQFLLTEVRKPMCTDEIVRAVPNQQVAAQIYAASLLAVEADTAAERAYLKGLAKDLKLDARVVSQMHATLGIAS